MAANPIAAWDRVGDRFYRKLQLYTDVFDPDLELDNHLIASAPYSGALALHRDASKVYHYRPADPHASTIDIYTCAGKLIKRLNWDGRPIRGLGWSEDETLVVVSRDGSVRLHEDLSDDYTPFSLGSAAEEHGVINCKFWLSGFVALLGNNQLISVPRYNEPRPKVLATPPSDPVVSWTIIPPAYTLSRSVETLLAISQTINVVDATDSEDRMLQNGPFRHMCVSPNGRFIALYTDDGKVWVISGDFQEKLSEYDARIKTLPKDMQWCGNDAVVLAWEDEVHLVGPNGAASRYYYDAWVHLVPDVDGIRLFTSDICEFIQKVPDVSEDTFKVGSDSTAAVLLDAVDQLDRKSPKADDNIQLIKFRMVEAVDSCINAAGYEFDHHWQKQLLRAASLGKSVLDAYDSDGFVNTCETVRVLNAVRFHEIGMPLSYEQYERLNPERLIQRLVNRQEYLLAFKICEYLHIPSNRVYVHWASQKVRVSTEPEESICKRIVDRVDGQRGISYEDIARAAHDEGRRSLATLLLEYEPRAGKQVLLLLDMAEDTLALDKSIESGDTDLVLHVLLHLRKKLPLSTFFRTINIRPVATALVESTARDQDTDLLKDLFYQDDRRLDGANLLFADGLTEPNGQAKSDRLRSAARLLHDSREHAAHARSIDEYARLLRLQDSLDNDPNLFETPPSRDPDAPQRTHLSGLPLNTTIYTLIQHGALKRAAQIAADFKIPDRTVWWLRLRGLVAARSWLELESLGTKTRKSPIGWEPFVHEIAAAGNLKLAGDVFVGKCTNVSAVERAEMYVRCGMVGRAAEEAVKGKERAWLEGLRGRVGERDRAEVERWISVLDKGRR